MTNRIDVNIGAKFSLAAPPVTTVVGGLTAADPNYEKPLEQRHHKKFQCIQARTAKCYVAGCTLAYAGLPLPELQVAAQYDCRPRHAEVSDLPGAPSCAS